MPIDYPDTRPTREQAIDRINQAARVLSEWKDEAELYFEMYAGEQWSDDVTRVLEEQEKPAIVFNHILKVINAVAGTEVTNKFAPKYRPRSVGPRAAFADMLNGALRYIRDQTDASDEESQAYMDALICGIGAVEFSQDYTHTAEGRTLVERKPVFNLWWDYNTEKPNMKDGRWVADYFYMPKEEAIDQWPEYSEEIENYVESYQDLDGQAATQVETRIAGEKWYEKDRDEVLIYKYHYRKLEPYFLSVDPDTKESVEYTVEEWKNLRENIKGLNDRATDIGAEQAKMPAGVRLSRYRYYVSHFMGNITLDDDETPTQSGFPIKFITCFRHQRPEGVDWFGLVSVMKDPQQWSNRMLVQLAHIIATNPKGAILAEEGVFEDEDKAMDDWGKANAVIRVREGALVEGSVKIIQGAYPDNQERLYQLSTEAVNAVLGFSPIQVGGQADLRRTSGEVVKFVNQSSEAMLSFPFQSLKAYRKAAGEQYLEHMRVFMPDKTLIRISSPGMADQVVPFRREWVENVKYDVVLDETPVTATQQKELWDSMQVTQVYEVLAEQGIMTPDITVEIIPNMPEEIRNKMRENIAEQDAMQQMFQLMQQGDFEGVLQIVAQVAESQGVEVQPPAMPGAEQEPVQ